MIQIVYTAQVLIFILYLIFRGLKTAKSDNPNTEYVYKNIYLVIKILFPSDPNVSPSFSDLQSESRLVPTSDMDTIVKQVDGYTSAFVVFSSLGVFVTKIYLIVDNVLTMY